MEGVMAQIKRLRAYAEELRNSPNETTREVVEMVDEIVALAQEWIAGKAGAF